MSKIAGIHTQSPTQTKLTSGSGTYTIPTGVKYLRVRMVGGGGGGSSPSTAGSNGNTSTFGTSLLTCLGGAGAVVNATNATGGLGGTATINSPAIGIAAQGQSGSSGIRNNTYTDQAGYGGSTIFGAGGQGGSVGSSGTVNSGAGGGGITGGGVGQGGGAGGYIDAIIYAPASTYSYTVAAATTGSGGGNGAAGVIIIDEFYV